VNTSVRVLLAITLACCAMHLPHAGAQAYGSAGQQVAVKKSQTTAPYGYWEYLPSRYNEASGEKFGLMIFLHGAGEKGDGESTLNALTNGGGWPTNLIAKNGKTYPVIVLSPQCSEPGPNPPAHQPCSWWNQARLVEFARYAIQRYAVDKNRVYVTGLSMGGAGTHFLIRGMPNEIAAAIPICAAGGGNAAQDVALRNMPLWVTHALDDPTVNVGESKHFVNAVTAETDDIFSGYDYGEAVSDQVATYRLSTQTHTWQKATSFNLIDSDARLRFTVYRTGGHGIWTRTYADDNIMNWLFQQKLQSSLPTCLPNMRMCCTTTPVTTLVSNAANVFGE
jgi:predicted peptidase